MSVKKSINKFVTISNDKNQSFRLFFCERVSNLGNGSDWLFASRTGEQSTELNHFCPPLPLLPLSLPLFPLKCVALSNAWEWSE